MNRPCRIAGEKAYGKEIKHHPESPGEPVFRLANGARSMIDRQLGHLGSEIGCQSRQEPMHLAIEPDATSDLGTIGLDATTEIMKFYARHTANDSIGNP